MADTRIDSTLHDGDPPEPAPITERDPALQPAAPPPSPAGGRLAVAAAVLAAVLFVAAVAVYLFVVRSD